MHSKEGTMSVLIFGKTQNETKNENILTHWSVAQAGSNDEKNWGSKILLDCPFKSKLSILVFPSPSSTSSSLSVKTNFAFMLQTKINQRGRYM